MSRTKSSAAAAPHLPSDDSAILAAADMRLENARLSLRAAVEALELEPTSDWAENRVAAAARSFRLEAVAGQRRELQRLRAELAGAVRVPDAGRGLFLGLCRDRDGSLQVEPYPPQLRDPVAGGIVHAADSPLHKLAQSSGAASSPRIVMGDTRPVDPTIAAGDPA
jgi:hypothetical protein